MQTRRSSRAAKFTVDSSLEYVQNPKENIISTITSRLFTECQDVWNNIMSYLDDFYYIYNIMRVNTYLYATATSDLLWKRLISQRFANAPKDLATVPIATTKNKTINYKDIFKHLLTKHCYCCGVAKEKNFSEYKSEGHNSVFLCSNHDKSTAQTDGSAKYMISVAKMKKLPHKEQSGDNRLSFPVPLLKHQALVRSGPDWKDKSDAKMQKKPKKVKRVRDYDRGWDDYKWREYKQMRYEEMKERKQMNGTWIEYGDRY